MSLNFSLALLENSTLPPVVLQEIKPYLVIFLIYKPRSPELTFSTSCQLLVLPTSQFSWLNSFKNSFLGSILIDPYILIPTVIIPGYHCNHAKLHIVYIPSIKEIISSVPFWLVHPSRITKRKRKKNLIFLCSIHSTQFP